MEQNNDITNFPKHGTRKFIRALFLALGIIGAFLFTAFFPTICWEIYWSDLVAIATNQTPNIQLINKITELAEVLGITSDNLRSWAIERIAISIAVGIGLLIFIYIITLPLKEKESKNEK